MTVLLKKPTAAAVGVHVVDRASFATHLRTAPEPTRRWLQATGFQGEADRDVLVPDADGGLKEVWAGVGAAGSPWVLSALPGKLPPGRYQLAADGLEVPAQMAALSWELGAYRFDAYRATRTEPATLMLAPGLEAERGLMLATAIASVRDLVNTPAEHLGPAELAAAVKLVAAQHGAKVKETVGDRLLKAGFPAIHAVGRAATREPRLIELNWGDPKHPKLAIVGKGVCFDSGGLDLKSAEGMRLMKKDMGGAANALGLAQMVMALKLPVRLQLLIPAVENAVAGNAFRPGDVFKTRAGLHIEIGNTDAEGRVILCDALAYAAESKPELIIDLATLTGAARTALGPALPALFTRDTTLARRLMDEGLALQDPLWQLPLWDGYHANIESPIADIVNTGRNPMGGAITAALFLADFVPASIPWLHIDLFSWNDQARPGRPVGGEAQTLRTLLAYLEARFGA